MQNNATNTHAIQIHPYAGQIHPYAGYLLQFKCKSYQTLYSCLETIAKEKMGLENLPFSLSTLENPPKNKSTPEIHNFMKECGSKITGDNSEQQAKQLIQFLKENPPKEIYGNPKLPDGECTPDERYLMAHIFSEGIDLPGSKYNLYGHLQYLSNFFCDLYFGNYTELMNHIYYRSEVELNLALTKRESYCQFSLLFAPILGVKMSLLDSNPYFTIQEKQEIRKLYSEANENKHLEIMKKLLEVGADPNDHDIFGFTPLHYCLVNASVNEEWLTALLNNGANPNSISRNGWTPLFLCGVSSTHNQLRRVDILLDHNAKMFNRRSECNLRASVETYGSKTLAVKVREAFPMDKNECERCAKPAVKMCAACNQVYYCTPACQKQDWQFHKVSCKKNKKDK